MRYNTGEHGNKRAYVIRSYLHSGGIYTNPFFSVYVFQAKPEYLLPVEQTLYNDGSVSTKLGLRFVVKHRHFQKNEMRLRCTATLSKVRRMASEVLEAEISEQHMSDLHVDFNTGEGMHRVN